MSFPQNRFYSRLNIRVYPDSLEVKSDTVINNLLTISIYQKFQNIKYFHIYRRSPHKPSKWPAIRRHNYCSNPDNDPKGAWCYTIDKNTRWEYCDIPRCNNNIVVNVRNEIPVPVPQRNDGLINSCLSQWAKWSSCTQSCGTGVRPKAQINLN